MVQPAQPVRIWEIGDDMDVWFAMLAGTQLDLFTPLDGGPLATQKAATQFDAAKLSLLMYILVLAGLGTFDEGWFANTDVQDGAGVDRSMNGCARCTPL
jgi:hypothetical protein